MRRSVPTLLALLALLAGLDPRPAAPQGQTLPRPPLPPATRGPLTIRFTPDGARAVVAESDTHTLALLDRKSGRVLRRFPSGGEEPGGLAITPEGAALVAHRLSGDLALLDLETGRRLAALSLRGEPAEVVLTADGRRAFVSLPALNQVAVVDVPPLRLRARIPVGRRPRALALAPDGRLLLVANFQGGDVSLVDTAALRETRRIATTGVNLRGLAVSPDGRRAFVTGQIPANTRATDEPLDIWTNTVFVLDLRPGVTFDSAEGWLDFALAASPDPQGIVALETEKVAVALSGSDEALLVRTPGPHLRSYDPVIERRQPVGAHPRGLALSPDGKELWVANQLDSTLSVLDAATLSPLRRISLGVPNRPDPRQAGRYLFGNARITSGHQFTCNSCHPDGGADGLTWEFVHVPDGLRLRNTRVLRGDLSDTAPFRWSGHEPTLEGFFQDEVTGLLHGPKQEAAALAALREFVRRLPLPPNPYREADGSFTPAAERGRRLFEGKAGCIACHSGPKRGGTGARAWIGTTPEGRLLDVPHLVGVYDSAPYLHDGRAETLEAIFREHDPNGRHGNARRLAPEELSDLLRYVREL